MSTAATLDTDEDDIANAYQTITWINDQLSFWTETRAFLRLQYDDENLTFLDNYKKTMALEQLLKDLDCKNQRIYIEWVQSTGKYLYFDVLQIVKTLKTVCFPISTLLYDEKNVHGIAPVFDESTDPKKVLNSDDIVLLSPIRSLQLKFTVMQQRYGHTLYLGGLPTKAFMRQCFVRYLFNCCGYSNQADILQLPNVEEHGFDVAGWTVGRVDSDDDDDDEEDDEVAEAEEEKCMTVAEQKKQSDELRHLQMQYLDKKIDAIDALLKDGNVLIHCLAGAHRSPFITGCYEYKYGTMNGKTPREVYQWLTGLRDLVQPLGYDRLMDDYFQFLAKDKHNVNQTTNATNENKNKNSQQ